MRVNIIKITALLLFMLFVLGSCREVPVPPVPPEEIKPLIVEIHLFEGWLEVQRYPADSAKAIAEQYYPILTQKHGFTLQEYEEAYAWYEDHPKQMDKLYQSVIDSLSMLEAEYRPPKEAEEDKE